MEQVKPFYMFTFKFRKGKLNMSVKSNDYEDALHVAVDSSRWLQGEIEFLGKRINKSKDVSR